MSEPISISLNPAQAPETMDGPSPSGKRNTKRENWAPLDGLRGIAILFVVLIHLWAHANSSGAGLPITLQIGGRQVDLTWFFATGYNAVVVFFVLSGFLLYRHWLEIPKVVKLQARAAQFYKKRARRIFPAFLFFSAIYLALVLTLGRHHFGSDTGIASVLLDLTFLSPAAALAGHTGHSLDLVPGTWSLNPEMWFYLIMPGLAFLFARESVKWVLLVTFVCLISFYRTRLGPAPDFLARHSLPGVADAFLVGMAVAGFSASGLIRRSAGVLFPLGALWYVAICAGTSPAHFDDAFQLALASALMIAGAIAPGNWPWKRWLSGAMIVRIGHMSFSMFLCNIIVIWYVVLPVTQVFGIESVAGRFVANLIIGFPVIYLLSWVAYRFIEMPFLSRDPLVVRRVASSGIAIAAAVLLISSVPAATAYVVNDGFNVEFSGILPRLAGYLARPTTTNIARVVPLEGKATVDSETQRADLSVEEGPADEFHVVSKGVKTGDRWIAIMLPVKLSAIARRHLVVASATLSSGESSPTEACLGIYNGKEDSCSQRASLTGTKRLEVRTRISMNGVIQFKLNIFPDPHGQPFDFRLHHLRVYQY